MWRFFIRRDQLATVSWKCVCLSDLRSRLWSGLNLEAKTKQPPNVWSNKRYFWPGAIKLSENICESSRNDLINKPTQVRPQISKTLTSIKPEPTHLDSMPPPSPPPLKLSTHWGSDQHTQRKRGFVLFFFPFLSSESAVKASAGLEVSRLRQIDDVQIAAERAVRDFYKELRGWQLSRADANPDLTPL